MGKIVKDRIIYGGIDSALQNKVGSAPLDTVAQDLSGAVNELKASGGTITDVQVDGVSVVTSGVADIDLTGKADAATTLSGYGITDANINNGTITLGSNTITPLTSHQDISGKVNKAGDTMTGNLTISNSLLGSYILKNNSYTINTSSNNGVSSFSGNNFEMQDSASTISTKFGNYLSSDGSVEAIISAHNKKTDGTAISNSLEIKIAKDGTKSYAVSDPAAFRSAIGAGQANTIATGDSNGQIKVTPSSGSAYNVSVKGLGSAAYLTANTAASNSTVVQRNSSGYIYANYFNTTCAEVNPSSYTNPRGLFVSSDGFIRKATAANFRTMLQLGSMATINSPVPIANGGTGKTSAADARSALGCVQKKWTCLAGSSLLAKNKLNDTISLSESTQNFQIIAIRLGTDTDNSKGGGQYWWWIPAGNCQADAMHGHIFQCNGTIGYITIKFTSVTAIKIIYTCVGGTAGSNLPGNGIRAVYGLNY